MRSYAYALRGSMSSESPARSWRVEQRVGEVDHALLVGVGDHQGPVAPLEHLLEHHDLAGPLEPERVDDVQRVVEQDLLPLAQRVRLDRRGDGDPQLAAAGEHVHGAVLVPGQEHAVPARRLRQPVDLLLEGDDLGARLLQRGDEALVVLGATGRPGPARRRAAPPVAERAGGSRSACAAPGRAPPGGTRPEWRDRGPPFPSVRLATSASSLRATSHLPGGRAGRSRLT